MADAPDTPPKGTTAPEDDKAAALTAARELLMAEGHQVLDSSAFHGIKTKAAAAAEAQLSELAAKHESLQSEHAKLADWKTKLDNEDKSENELHASERRAWMEADKGRIAELDVANKAAAELQKSLERERVQNHLVTLVSSATNTEAALMWADRHIGKMLSTDETRNLVWTDLTGVPHVGPAAAKLVSDWWHSDEQKFLRASNEPGPATTGAASAPAQKSTEYQQLDPHKHSFEQRLEHANAWEQNRTNGA